MTTIDINPTSKDKSKPLIWDDLEWKELIHKHLDAALKLSRTINESRPRKCPKCEAKLSGFSENYQECGVCGWSEGRNSLEKYLDKEDWWL